MLLDFEFKNMTNAIFTTTQSDLIKYNGSVVLVLCPLNENEYDREDVGNMYKIRLFNGDEIDAFEDELEII